MEHLYSDIERRTGGNIYIGVVGPVRTGKSTLIKTIMEKLVIPAIEDPYRRERARDELPQSGSGRTIMTAEPKFIPEEAVEISPDGKTNLRVRFIDSVGYMIPGAVGAEEEGQPRMVTTPWFDREIPMTEAAELGTKKVMDGHCSIGLVVTTDGTVTDIPRADYMEAEKRAIRDMQATGKPYLVIVNSRSPGSDNARAVGEYIRNTFGTVPMIADCQAMDVTEIGELLHALLLNFPLGELRVFMPRWLDTLEPEHPVKAALYEALLAKAEEISCLAEAEEVLQTLRELEQVADVHIRGVDLAGGAVECAVSFPEQLFYDILSQRTGVEIAGDGELMNLLTELTAVKAEYDKIADALNAVKATGYGVVMPALEDMALEKPQMLRKGGAWGIRLKAGAPSIHMIRVDIDTEISPMVGDEKQSKELVDTLSAAEADQLWQSNIFGKSVSDMIRDGLNTKVAGLPQDVRAKFRGTLTRVVNEGANGLICLIL
ncbi:MAG: stage IV sporulation protein A [Oscillospiraceae bacterium]|nr:stage IV sporulation protein A [Oscillospiraceae bacterium]